MKHFALLLVLSLIAAPAFADRDDQDLARLAREAGEILPLSNILEAAMAEHAGRVIEVDLEREDGRWVYELELVSPDGRLYEMEIDAASGKILKVEDEGHGD
jgi:uncharacterized membrane protein YkoI